MVVGSFQNDRTKLTKDSNDGTPAKRGSKAGFRMLQGAGGSIYWESDRVKVMNII